MASCPGSAAEPPRHATLILHGASPSLMRPSADLVGVCTARGGWSTADQRRRTGTELLSCLPVAGK
jgi:hypothetical protein